MTTNEKAKAYDEALERFRAFKEKYYTRDTNLGDVIFDKTGEMQKDFETIFPELHEEEKPLTPFQQCLSHILYKVYYASAPGRVGKFILDTVKKFTDELVELAKRQEKTDCQLRESEDERIRKAIIKSIEEDSSVYEQEVSKEQMLAWLEKQKEQIPYIDFVIKPHKGDDNNPYDMRVSEAQEYAIKRGFGVPFNDGEVYVDERHLTQTIGNILRWADEHPKEQKDLPLMDGNADLYFDEWNQQKQNPTKRQCFEEGIRYATRLQKEQKPTPDWMPKFLDKLRSMKNYFDWDEHREIEGHILAIINWIAPNYFDRKEKEQKPISQEDFDEAKHEALWGEPKPAEWSEEDKQWLSEVYFAIDHSMYSEDERQAMKKYIDSLRPSWKPTEEQMKALEVAFRKDGDDEYRNIINSLYNDLKKL